MRKLDQIDEVRALARSERAASRRVGLVPTMGALHEGHFSLMRAARAECECVIVSIFVNPTQFGPGEDFGRYPRPIEADLDGCRREGVDVVFCPSAAAMYPRESLTKITVGRLGDGLCGPHRPGHFEGVATVVAKLFHIVEPDVAYFGQKDYQQSVIVRRMVDDLNFPLRVAVCPTVREADGLAMSSRNAYLSPSDRAQAASLSAALFWARDQAAAGERSAARILQEMRRRIESAGPCRIDYIECVDAQELSPKDRLEGQCVFLLAVRIGSTRLIDNVVVDGPSTSK